MQQDSEFDKIKTFTEYCNHLLPYAIRYGMPIEHFWHKEAELFFAYRSSYLMEYEETLEKGNYLAWLSGIYNLKALWEVHSYINLPENRKHEAIKYYEDPIDIFDTKANKVTRDDIIKKRRKEEEDKIKVLVSQTQMNIKLQEKLNKK